MTTFTETREIKIRNRTYCMQLQELAKCKEQQARGKVLPGCGGLGR